MLFVEDEGVNPFVETEPYEVGFANHYETYLKPQVHVFEKRRNQAVQARVGASARSATCGNRRRRRSQRVPRPGPRGLQKESGALRRLSRRPLEQTRCCHSRMRP